MDPAIENTSGLGFGIGGTGTLVDTLAWASAGAKEADWGLLSSYAGLLALAVLSIYAGAHGSLPVGDPLPHYWLCLSLIQGIVEAETRQGREGKGRERRKR